LEPKLNAVENRNLHHEVPSAAEPQPTWNRFFTTKVTKSTKF